MIREKQSTLSQHVRGGFYYVVRRSRSPGQPIFSDALDYATFESLLALALARYRCRLHAFYWEPDAIHLAMQVSDRSVGRFLRWLCTWYSRSASKGAVAKVLFAPNYWATLIEHVALPSLIRDLHLRAAGAGTATEPADSALSSHRAYLGIVHIPWLTTSVALRMLAPSVEQARLEYRRMMRDAGALATDKEVSRQEEREPAMLFAGVEQHRQLSPELFELPSLRERNVDSLQIRAVPVLPEKDARL